MGSIDRLAVGAVLRATGEREKASKVAAELVEEAAKSSPVHDRGHFWLNGYVALLNEDIDSALDFFGEYVERGFVGVWDLGTPVLFPWLMAPDARFDTILKRIMTNRDRQLAELQPSSLRIAVTTETALSPSGYSTSSSQQVTVESGVCRGETWHTVHGQASGSTMVGTPSTWEATT